MTDRQRILDWLRRMEALTDEWRQIVSQDRIKTNGCLTKKRPAMSANERLSDWCARMEKMLSRC